jgi:type IV pilus assembly protein PilM
MKRDQVFRSLEPLRAVGVDVDFVQLAPLALYNFLVFDQLQDLPTPEEYDPEDPPPSWIVLSMGTDATDLVVTNGFRVWQRSVPIGGNHFTKALTKELRLTFAKAEHLKRNASSAQDPKAVFQAMRPVFSDLLTEIQRSVNYFGSIDRTAKIEKVLALGNGMKLPGLQRYLGQNLGYELAKLDSFRGLVGPEVVGAPAFKENVLTFATSYGLALQGLDKSSLKTNLLPGEIVKDRLVRQKKPWAVAAAAVLLLGCTISFASLSRAVGSVDEAKYGPAVEAAESATSESQSLKGEQQTEAGKFEETDLIGKHLVSNIEGRLRWLELLKAVNSCLPRDPAGRPRPEEIPLRNELHVTSFQCYHMPDLATWFEARKRWYDPPEEKTAEAAEGAAEATGPTGPGWLIRMEGYHYHNRTPGSGETPPGST